MRTTVLSIAMAGLALALQASGCTSTGDSDAGPTINGGVCLPLDAGLPVVAPWLGVDAGPGGEPLEEFANDYFEAFCDGMSKCIPFESYMIPACVEQLRTTGVWSYTECSQIPLGLACQGICEPIAANLLGLVGLGDAGFSYDPELAAACLSAPWTACAAYSSGEGVIPPPACSSVFACEDSFQCADGVCVVDAGSCLPVPPLRPGSLCTYDAGCGSDGGLTCDGVYCRGNASLGTSCADLPIFGCAPGLFCNQLSQTCESQLAPGGACSSGSYLGPDIFPDCQSGLICRGQALLTDGGTRLGSCQPPSRLGESCVELSPDEVQHISGCVVGDVCSCTVCVPPPSSGPCADGLIPCLPGASACDFSDAGVCQPLESFKSCMNDQQCATGSYCDDFTSCAPYIGSCL